MTRTPASFVLGYLTAGKAAEEIVEEFAGLSHARISAYARDVAEFEEVG